VTSNSKPDVRHIVIHKPGPKWAEGVDFRDQEGVVEHVRHYQAMHEAGQLQIGGPFLIPDSGGMMIPVQGLPEDEVRQIAAADPAAKRGLLEFEIRPWYVTMKKATD